MRKRISLLLFLSIIHKVSSCQNYIYNGDFEKLGEEYSTTPPFTFICPIDWTLINTVDVYSKADSTMSGVCNKRFIEPQSGNNYIGISNFNYLNPNYREYVLYKFHHPLIGHKKYVLNLQYRFSNESSFFCNNLNVFFINVLDSLHDYIYYSNHNIDSTSLDLVSKPTEKWISITDTIYVASDQFCYLGIGNLIRNDKKLAIKKRKMNIDCSDSYYFIDNVSLMSLENIDEDRTIESISESSKNLTNSFFSVRFKYGGVDILEEFNDSMIMLIDTLINNPIEVHLIGYTDSIGNDEDNITLSKARALKISEILIKSGVKSEKIFISYNGENSPVKSNSSEFERSLNRRVEVVINKIK